jgi:small subunit ribosomal protein S9
MVTKKTVKKAEPKKKVKAKKKPEIVEDLIVAKEISEVKKTKEEKSLERYFYAVGRRKSSIAQVKLYPSDKKESVIEINKKDLDKYFSLLRFQNLVRSPLAVAGENKFFISIHLLGGGITGQAEAARLGIARALVKFNEEVKKTLKDLGFLTRDSRVVERKKPGKRKARRSPQWAKR